VLNLILGAFNNFQKRLARCDTRSRLGELTHLHEFYQQLDENMEQIKYLWKEKLTKLDNHLDKINGILKVLNPKNVLERGYGYVETQEGTVLSSVQDFDKLEPRTQLNLHLHDGKRKIQKIAE
jgi:exonuclease VII large subunit